MTMLTNRSRTSKELGALDLTSLMTGLIIIGLIGGVIAATVFAIVPWTQDEAAKQEVQNVAMAQRANQGLALPVSVNGTLVRTDDKPELETPYSTLQVLVGSGLLTSIKMKEGSTNMSADGKVCLTSGDGNYRVWVVSDSGRHIFFTSNTIGEVTVNETSSKYQHYDPTTSLCEGFSSIPDKVVSPSIPPVETLPEEPAEEELPGTEEPPAEEEPPAGEEVNEGHENTDSIGFPANVDKTDFVSVVYGDVIVESYLDDSRLKTDTSSTHVTLNLKNIGATSNSFKLKIHTNKIPYDVSGISAEHGTPSMVQENGQWFLIWEANQYNPWSANQTLNLALTYKLRTVTSDNFDITYGKVTGNEWYATQTVTLKNQSNYTASWVMVVDLGSLQRLNPAKTVSPQDGRYTLTHIEGDFYQVTNISENYALAENGSRELVFKLS